MNGTGSLDPQSGLGPFLQLTADSVVDLLGFQVCQVSLAGPAGMVTVAHAVDGAAPNDDPAAGRLSETLTDIDGSTIGWLSAVPGPSPLTAAQIDLLVGYARQAETAIRVSIAVRHDLEQIRAADASRSAVRRLAASDDAAAAWPEIAERIEEAYQAEDVLVHSLNLDGSATLVVTRQADHPGAATLDFLTAAARSAWQRREAEPYRFDTAATAGLSAGNRADVQRWSRAAGLGNALLVPIGATEECLGALLIARTADAPAWTETQVRGATALGADLGLVLYTRRTLETQGRYLDELQAIDAYQDDLLDTVTAMLRAPMRRIGERIALLRDGEAGGAESGVESGVGDDPGAATTAEIAVDVGQMTSLVDDLLFFSRVTDPRRSREAEVINVATLARQVADHVFPMAAGLSLRVRSSGAFPLVRGDEDELTQLLTTVITNAVQYTAQGAVTVTVASGATEAEITVADTGIGILAEDEPHVFEEFYRGANTEGISGNGLGLAIASRVAEHHGGRIELSTVPGEGTSVRIYLPLTAAG
ncbi:HAMP domain-containing sensor histidine kinase [Nocardioides sp.]|uniref:sensor histidine kinase n=1 Tax=Nocardioides sp. TaxID=35761 RepID=UPI00261D3279|nr:HAMP domain-containing sensor histidine kinase [Nocardioides sp.]